MFVVSFDFDDTLRRFDGTPIARTCARARLACACNLTVLIISTRTREPGNLAEIKQFCQEHQIPFHGIVLTHGRDKVHWLRHLNMVEHWDDDPEEIRLLAEAGIRCRHVPVDTAAFLKFHGVEVES